MNQKMPVNYANRGMAFEEFLEHVHQEYEARGIAAIEKIPTPVKVLKIQEGHITDAFFLKKSCVDYNGTYRSRSIWFDAKSTQEVKRFSLSLVHEHQVERLITHTKHGAICFLLVAFENIREYYLMPIRNFLYYWNKREAGVRGTNSIPIEDFKTYGFQVSSTSRASLDYLKVVDCLIQAEAKLRF